MEVTKKVVERSPAVPAVTEEVVVLELSVHEARILRALCGKSRSSVITFLSRLNHLFPDDYKIDYAGIYGVEIKGP